MEKSIIKNTEILNLSNPAQTGNTVFRSILGKVKDLPLSLAFIENDKRIRAKAESIREVLKEKEPESFEQMRKDKDEALEGLYQEFIRRPEIQDFLKAESDIEWKQVRLTRKYVENAGFDSDQVEILMLFTNIVEIIELIEKEKGDSTTTKKPDMKVVRSKRK